MNYFLFSTIGFMLLVFLRCSFLQMVFLQATTNMHQDMAKKVIRADIVFFDSNPSGRVTTRFAKDMTILDVMVPPVLMLVTQGMLRAVSVVISVAIVNPWILIVAFIGVMYMLYVVKTAMPTMVDA